MWPLWDSTDGWVFSSSLWIQERVGNRIWFNSRYKETSVHTLENLETAWWHKISMSSASSLWQSVNPVLATVLKNWKQVIISLEGIVTFYMVRDSYVSEDDKLWDVCFVLTCNIVFQCVCQTVLFRILLFYVFMSCQHFLMWKRPSVSFI